MHQRVMKPRFDRPERRQVRNVTPLLARPLKSPPTARLQNAVLRSAIGGNQERSTLGGHLANGSASKAVRQRASARSQQASPRASGLVGTQADIGERFLQATPRLD